MAVRLTGRQSRHGAGSENLFTLADRQTSNNAALSINSRPPHTRPFGRFSRERKYVPKIIGDGHYSCKKVVKLNYFFQLNF